MKKLMVAAAVAMLGIAAHAAACSWDMDNVYASDGSGNYGAGYLAYYVDSADWSADIAADLGKGDFTSFLAIAQAASDLTDAEGYADGTTGDMGYVAGQFPQAYAVIFDSDDLTTAENFFVSDLTTATSKVTQQGGNATLSFGDLEGSKIAENWQSVPEPTSGLLLLLGVAGLALKRRRA